MALTDNLVSYWKLDETSGTRADSHGTNDLTDVNTVASGVGKIGNAADFEITGAPNEALRKTSPTGFGITSSFSISTWIKQESNTTGFILYKGTAGTTDIALYMYSVGDVPVLNYGGTQLISSVGITTGTFYHIVGVHDDTANTDYIYIDGSLATSATGKTGNPTNTASHLVSLGMHADGSSSPYDGMIDEIGFWSRVLTSTEVSELYNGGAGLTYPFAGGTPIFVPRVSFIM